MQEETQKHISQIQNLLESKSKIMKLTLLFCYLLLVISLLSCREKEGKMTATIDGKLWKSEIAIGSLEYGYYTPKLILMIFSEKPQTSFLFHMNYKALKEKTYHTKEIKKEFYISYGSHKTQTYNYNSNTTHISEGNSKTKQQYKFDKGILKITKLDTIHKRISGTFNFVMLDFHNKKKGIKVTNGVFDNIFYGN